MDADPTISDRNINNETKKFVNRKEREGGAKGAMNKKKSLCGLLRILCDLCG